MFSMKNNGFVKDIIPQARVTNTGDMRNFGHVVLLAQ
jgi:hypothetical protein